MNTNRMIARPAVAFFVGLVLVAGVFAAAVPASAQGEPYVELMRQNLKTEKIAVMTEAMALTEEQGEKFWPIYREYQTELSGLGDQRIAAIKDYAEHFETMTGEKASELTKNYFKRQKSHASLLEKTAKKIAKETDPVVAARFIQVENILNMVIDLQVASELPLFE